MPPLTVRNSIPSLQFERPSDATIERSRSALPRSPRWKSGCRRSTVFASTSSRGSPRRDFNALLHADADNVFVIKVSYWIGL